MSNEKIWWYSTNDTKFGPYTSAEFKLLADSGKITPVTLVWKIGIEHWIKAKSVNGLFKKISDIQPPPLPSPATPTSQKEVSHAQLAPPKTAPNDLVVTPKKFDKIKHVALVGVLTIGFLMSAGMVAISFLTQGDSQKPNEYSSNAPQINDQPITQLSTPAPIEPQIDNQQSTRKDYTIGEKITQGRFETTITSAETSRFVGNGFFISKASNGAIYLSIQITYKNTSSGPISAFEAPKVYLLSRDQVQYEPDIEATIAYASSVQANKKSLSNINPGITISDAYVFEVNEEQFDPSTWIILIKLGNSSARILLT